MTGKALGSFMRKGFFRQKADAVLGVDISDTAVRLVELGRSSSGYTVQRYAAQVLPDRVVVEGSLLDLERAGQALHQALSRLRTSLKHAAIAVAGPSVITQVIEMAAGLSDEERSWKIQMEADQYSPYPLDDVALDFQVQGPCAGDPARVEVLLAFACVALAAVWLADQVIDRAIDRQVTRNSHQDKEIAVLDARIQTIDDLQAQSQQLAQRMKVVEDVHDARSSSAQLLDQLARSVPDGVHLHEVVAKGDTVSIRGSAESSQDIAQLMRRLEASQGAHATRLQHVRTDGARGNNEFQLMVRQGESGEAQP